MADSKPPLALAAIVTTPEGVTAHWGADARSAGNVPQNMRFATRLGDGFADGSVTLARRIDRDYVDINLLDDIAFVGHDGTTAYEGRVSSNPRSIGDTHSMDVVAAGWMANSRDHKCQIIFSDRDFGNWIDASRTRRASLLGSSFGEPSFTVTTDDSGTPALQTSVTGAWANPGLPMSEAWYDAGPGVMIASLYYAWEKGSTVVLPDANWNWKAFLATDDNAASADVTANLAAAGPGTGTVTATTADRRYAGVQSFYTVAAGGEGVSYPIWWTCLAVYGDHGLTKQGTADATNAQGFYVSDMVRYVITQFCPKLDPSGITATSYVVQHAVYLDPTDPFDVIADLNKYHRFNYGVEEKKRFFFRPIDLTDYDWQIDYYEPGVTISLQGDSTEDAVYNGAAVNFTNLQTGKPDRITPDTNPELADADPDNPANRAGVDRWLEVPLSFPALPADAAQIGAAALAEANRPKFEGTITVHGHVRDRAGHWQQGWKVRAGDRVVITSSTSLSDRPRIVSETQWDHDSKTLTITLDTPAQQVDAFQDRVMTALQAANLV